MYKFGMIEIKRRRLHWMLGTALIFTVFPIFLNIVIGSVSTLYYEYSDVENFYKSDMLIPHDVCLGSIVQVVESSRNVYVEDGLQAYVTREWFTYPEGVMVAQEDKGWITLEPRGEEFIVLLLYHPPLAVGSYTFQIKSLIKLPKGVLRTDVPIKTSEVYNVINCNE